MKDIPWDNPECNVLDDIAAVAELAKVRTKYVPDSIICSLHTFAYIMLGYLIYDKIVPKLNAAINYTLPRFTFRDHLRDCFGWLWLRPKRESTPSPFTQAMISLFADRVAPTDFLTPIFSSFLDNEEEVEIDIVRGG